jgi:outer membrane protein assembly factor BamA
LKPAPGLSFSPDFGLFVGGGFHRFQYGFRHFPHSSRVTLVGGFAFGANQPTVSLQLEQREVKHNLHVELGAELTGLDIIRFHGFGNESLIPAPSSFYRVDQKQSHFTIGLALEPSSNVRFTFGGVGKVAVTDRDELTFLQTLGTGFYGTGTFAQVGAQGGVRLDFRDRAVASTKGIVFSGGGSVYGPWIDVTETFGEVHGEVSAYATAWATLALRGAAKKVFGTFPFQEAAYLGGNSTLRGFAQQRFAGDASLLGSAELRFPLTKVRIIFPGNLGLHGLVDVGRVFSDFDVPGENTWHSAVGGGLWISVLDPANVLSVSIARSDERTGVYVKTGFHF